MRIPTKWKKPLYEHMPYIVLHIIIIGAVHYGSPDPRGLFSAILVTLAFVFTALRILFILQDATEAVDGG